MKTFLGVVWIVVFVLGMLLLIFLSSCTSAEMKFADGRTFKYSSHIFDKKFSEMTFYPDGSFTIVGYQSDATSAIRLAEIAISKIPVKP